MKTKKKIWGGVIAVLIVLIGLGTWYIFYLKKAHSTFKNYYAFRGCTTILNKSEYYGFCELKNGDTIKIVKYQGKWYLDGDLPTGHFLDF